MHRTLPKIGVLRSPIYRWCDLYRQFGDEGLEDHRSWQGCAWNRILDEVRNQVLGMALERTELSPRELAVKFRYIKVTFPYIKKYFISAASVYRLLKAYNLIADSVFTVVRAANNFTSKTVVPNDLWKTYFTYLRVIGWGWISLSAILDNFSRYIIVWKLFTTMKLGADTLEVALVTSGLDRANVVHKPRLSLTYDSSYTTRNLAAWKKKQVMNHTAGHLITRKFGAI